jgi:hypothetical protein
MSAMFWAHAPALGAQKAPQSVLPDGQVWEQIAAMVAL